ncbi:hypothetical protein GH714_029731 [Hevea brasiliensis]|uniref:RNase H type-1 domain-containing protein n=1 Tax=Hevea brasiliensis TaxID=3981 RepID=A0A6A6LC37_HEVBR|nr:hypothetical protein GH714_029731 [Hevea brasiliensis]
MNTPSSSGGWVSWPNLTLICCFALHVCVTAFGRLEISYFFDNLQWSPHDIISHANVLVAEFYQTATHCTTTSLPSQRFLIDRWCPPPPGFLKLNVDAGMSSSGLVQLGVVFRDEFDLLAKLDDFSSEEQEYVWIEDIPNAVSAVLALNVSLLQ